MRTFIIILFIFAFSSYYSISIGGLFSTALDFIPIVSNVKGFIEACSGEDTITKEKLSGVDRSLSFVGAIPFGSFLKIGSHLKKGQKMIKVAEKVKKTGKIKNALKASGKALIKANNAQNIVRNTYKGIKALLDDTDNN